MGKQEETNRWNEESIRRYLYHAAEKEPVPDSLKPEQMEAWLRNAVEKEDTRKKEGHDILKESEETREKEGDAMGKENTSKNKKNPAKKSGRKSYRRWWYGTAAVAACLAVILFAAGRSMDWELGVNTDKALDETSSADTQEETTENKKQQDAASEDEEGTTYRELYQTFSKVWKEQDKARVFSEAKGIWTDEFAADASSSEEAVGVVEDMKAESAAAQSVGTEQADGDYAKTNQQEAEVEEADIVKNDGRYLYQVIYQEKNDQNTVQIVDTKDGLTETARVGEFDSIQDIYVWKDTLVVLESCWVQAEAEETEWNVDEDGLLQTVKNAVSDLFVSDDVAYQDTAYTRIHVYDISDRSKPEKYHTFTVKGSYKDSRILDGYLYFFTTCSTSKPRVERDYKAYIPMIDDEPLKEDKIYLPEESEVASYLVMASVNMEEPDDFTDTCALVTGADRFYVSKDNIYVADTRYADYGKEGETSDSTRIYRFSCKDGKMKKEAEGSVKGILRDDMAMNEYKGYLRMVTTVESQTIEEITDDITGDVIGRDVSDYVTTNSLYVLDQDLEITGKIENLAEDELVYSARFMGDAGYFVTFRQTDPLFSVDLSNPEHPKILGELKISGFSEYLHFYADDLLLGIGMEADEDTGVTEGMKLSMFDISNPSDVKEQSKMDLSQYDYSDALYDYKAVLIDTDKNLFGFSAESYGGEERRSYLLFSYENGEFKQLMKIDCSDYDSYSYRVRGTYIGDCFYLMCENGRMEAYSLTDGSKIGELEP